MNTPRSVQRVPARSALQAATIVVAGGIRSHGGGRRCHRRLPDPAPAMSYMASDDSSFITEIILSPAITAQRSSAVLCSPMQRRLLELKVVSSKDRRPAEHTHRLNSAAAGWSR